jgi:hypothetical protein
VVAFSDPVGAEETRVMTDSKRVDRIREKRAIVVGTLRGKKGREARNPEKLRKSSPAFVGTIRLTRKLCGHLMERA